MFQMAIPFYFSTNTVQRLFFHILMDAYCLFFLVVVCSFFNSSVPNGCEVVLYFLFGTYIPLFTYYSLK